VLRTRSGVLVGAGASLVVTASAIGAFAWAAPHEQKPTGFRAYLASDLGPQMLEVSPADLATGGPITSSSSQSGFLSAVSGIPDQMVAATVVSAADELGGTETMQILRAMSASVTTEGSTSSNFYVALVDDSGLLKTVEMGAGGFTLWYSPPLVELPPDVNIGATWSGTGSVNDIAIYEHEGVIESGPTDDCIVTLTTTKLLIEDSDPIISTLRTTWCQGLGSTRSVNEDTGRTVSVQPSIPRTSLAEAAPPAAAVYTQPATVPFLSPSVLLTAVVSGDVLVLANSTSQDLAAISLAPAPSDPNDADAPAPDPSVLRVAWMQHPSGEVLGLAGDGQNTFVTTTTRSVMSFDRAGGLRWKAATSDVAAGPPVVFDDIVAVATLDGSIFAFDRSTGEQLWSRTMSDAVVSDPVLAGSAVVVADIAGQVSAFDIAGEAVWTVDVDAVTRPLSALSDGSVLVGDDAGTAHLIGTDGVERWSAVLAWSIVGPAQLIDGVVVVPSKAALQGFALDDGQEQWLKDDWANSRVWSTNAGLSVTQGDRLASIDADGTLSPTQVIVEPDGEDVIDMQVVEISGQPSILTSAGSLLTWPGIP
jgi:outer membrane protein assembly factor BamB